MTAAEGSSWPRSTPWRAGGVGVVEVVPALAEREQGEGPQVGGPVVTPGAERPLADHVAEGVHAPGDVVEQGDADESRPQQGGQRVHPGPADEPARYERQGEGEDAQRREGAGDGADVAVGQQVGGVTLRRRTVVAEEPADVRVHQPAQLAAQMRAVAVRGVRIPRPVGEGVVAAVRGDPADDVTLETHRPGHRERDAHGTDGPVAAVGETTVEADRDAETRDRVEDEGDHDVGGMDEPPPQQPAGQADRHERQNDDHRRHRDVQPVTAATRGRRAVRREGGRPVVALGRRGGARRCDRRGRGGTEWHTWLLGLDADGAAGVTGCPWDGSREEGAGHRLRSASLSPPYSHTLRDEAGPIAWPPR